MNKINTTPEFQIKLLTLGETGVGKTSIILRYTDNSFLNSQLYTIGIDCKIKKIKIDNKLINVLIWDTAGQERFRNITSHYYNNADGILLVYDISNRESFENLNYWLNEINQKADKNKISIILVGNKSDINFNNNNNKIEENEEDNNNIIKRKREISYEEGKKMAESFNINFIETSALNSYNIEKCFDIIINEIIKKKGKNNILKGANNYNEKNDKNIVINKNISENNNNNNNSNKEECFC